MVDLVRHDPAGQAVLLQSAGLVQRTEDPLTLVIQALANEHLRLHILGVTQCAVLLNGKLTSERLQEFYI